MNQTVSDEVLAAMEGFVRKQLTLLKPPADSWQPNDLLPAMTLPGWAGEIAQLRERAEGLSDEVLVVLAGNLITEEALPSYQTWLNRIDAVKDKSGADDSPWALWTRGWTAEENRHGDVLNKYLYLSGRVDMRAIELTTQNLLRNGFDPRTNDDPYHALVYVAFQERATKIAHLNAGHCADRCGDRTLGRICATIAGDEARHEEAYKRFFGELMRLDPQRSIIAFAGMMRQKVAMPARLIDDGSEGDLFARFAIVAQRSGIYTTRDYADVISHLIDYWDIASMPGLAGEAAKAQDYLCGLASFYLAKVERIEQVLSDYPREKFRWIFDRVA